MKKIVLLLGVALVVGFGLGELADLTQARADHVPAGYRTELVFDVKVSGYLQSVDDAARNLWGACAGTVGEHLVVAEGVSQVSDGRYRLVLAPAIGEHSERKLRGCIEDATLDRIKGNVVAVTRIPA